MALAATTVPIELRRPDLAELNLDAFPADVFLNVLGYLPVGVVLATLNPGRVAVIALGMSAFAEASQLFMMHRQPSAVDIVCNVIGAALGAFAVPRARRTSPRLTLDHRVASVAVVLAATLMSFVWHRAPLLPNPRGWAEAGTLEAHWTFDEDHGSRAFDSSGYGHDGTLSGEPRRVPGIFGSAVSLDGSRDYVEVGRAVAFRLVGSMTVTAWIKPTRFPHDDAAIVSTHDGTGFQLDTTVDRGPRAIGFKLGNACGQLMARYGATPLFAGRWYHVAGVYDAHAKALDLYLNGRLDNGILLGTVTGSQRSSREALFIGRRSSNRGFEFAGDIDDVRVYSGPLTREQIDAVLQGRSVATGPFGAPAPDHAECLSQSDQEDSQIPGAAGVLGVLVAMIYFGFLPAARWVPCLIASLIAGLLLLRGTSPSLPMIGSLVIPLTTVGATMTVLVSFVRREPSS
jgi:hypothetical protein